MTNARVKSEDRKLKDQVFNRWTVISNDFQYIGKWPKAHWPCRCTCGHEQLVSYNNLVQNKIQGCMNCRNLDKSKPEEVIGKEYLGWKALRLNGSRNAALYECECISCGHKKNFTGNELRNKRVGKCLSCIPSQENNVTFRQFWKRLVWSASVRKLEINIGLEYILKLLKEQNNICALSGMPIYLSKTRAEKIKNMTTASVDRIDSSKGYIESNIQWVHKDINRMKQEFSDELFTCYCEKVYKHKTKIAEHND